MLDQNNCPHCKSTKSLSGNFESSEYGADVIEFFPKHISYFIFRPKVSVKSKYEFKVCIECGCVWNFIEPKVLQQYLSNKNLNGNNFPKPKSKFIHYGVWLALLAASLFFALILSNSGN